MLAQQRRIGLRRARRWCAMPRRASLAADFGPTPLSLARRQRPHPCRHVARGDDRQPVRLVEFGRDLGDQLVGRQADRATEAGRVAHRALEFARRFRARTTRRSVRRRRRSRRFIVAGQPRGHHLRQVDVDLVDAAVLDLRRDRAHCGLESREYLRYSSKSTGSRIASGALAAAFIMPIAELTPNARAS